MDDVTTLTDQALRLGEQIAGAVEAGAWERIPALAEQRAQLAQQLGARASSDGDGGPPRRAQLAALAEQHERLSTLLRERRGEIERELAQVDQLRGAHDSYEASLPRKSVLNARLAG